MPKREGGRPKEDKIGGTSANEAAEAVGITKEQAIKQLQENANKPEKES